MKTNERLLWQIFFWCITLLGLPLLLTNGQLPTQVLQRVGSILLGAVVLVSLNLLWFFPRWYQRGKIRSYLLVCAGVVVLLGVGMNLMQTLFLPSVALLRPGLPHIQPEYRKTVFYIGNFVPFVIVFLSSTLFEIGVFAHQSAREAAQLNTEKLEAELKFLKSQINPHFLFNTLNNIYTLTVLNPPVAGDHLLKLSEMLRYLLYECSAAKVPLKKELRYLRHYIALFQLKEDEQLNIIFEATDVDEEVLLAPLLLIPFVENALKHSQIEDLTHGWITIKLLGDRDQLYVEVKNSLPRTNFAKDSIGGIGLQNVRRQLELLYPQRHTLLITPQADEFSISLHLKL